VSLLEEKLKESKRTARMWMEIARDYHHQLVCTRWEDDSVCSCDEYFEEVIRGKNASKEMGNV
jgi:hypothetical protein